MRSQVRLHIFVDDGVGERFVACDVDGRDVVIHNQPMPERAAEGWRDVARYIVEKVVLADAASGEPA